MTTQLESARRNQITPEMQEVAETEDLSPKFVMQGVKRGRIVIPKNTARPIPIPSCGIGEGLRVKVNANIGTSPEIVDLDLEIEKAKAAMQAGTDTIMDLSTGGDIDVIRNALLKETPITIGTVPIYQAAIDARQKQGAIVNMTEDDMFNAIEKHCRDGVDFITVHCGITQESVERVIRQKRLLGIVSRGGTFLTAWIKHNDAENPLYANFDYLLELAQKYDVTLSLGDGLRPGCISDATDRAQIQELIIIGELVERARAAGVQSMVEGPGHIPFDQVAANVRLEKSVCNGAPFYVLGPLVTDVAPGYDHIVGAIGGTVAAIAGADFLCYVTPSEHIALPDVKDVQEGVIVTRIAAHAADLVKRRDIASQWDHKISEARSRLDWEGQLKESIDPDKFQAIRQRRPSQKPDEVCSMCGEFCAIRLLKEYIRAEH